MKAITVEPRKPGTARYEGFPEPDVLEGSVLVAASLVLKNNVLVGRVNANKRHWYKASERLARLDRKWLSRLITRCEKPENFKQALERNPDDIKVVIQFSEV